MESDIQASSGVETGTSTKYFQDPASAVLSACGLKKSFGKVQAVDGLDLTVYEGEIYGFLGVNGAGKTTALRMLMGIIKADDGSLELLGEKTRRATIKQKQSIGYVSQEQTFYPWMTCRALGRFVGGLYPNWDATEFERLVKVLDLPLDRKASQLSGGMRVKLALALALAPRPALLILDEPTSGLDPLARREFLEIIQQEAREHGRTTLFSSHIIGEIERVADRVGIIHRGRMLYEGSLEKLRASVRLVKWPLEKSLQEPPPLPSVSSVSEVVSVSGSAVLSQPSSELSEQVTNESLIPPIITTDLATVAQPASLIPAGFQILRDETQAGIRSVVLRAPPSVWETYDCAGAKIHPLPLEDIFVALVGKGAIVV